MKMVWELIKELLVSVFLLIVLIQIIILLMGNVTIRKIDDDKELNLVERGDNS